MFETHVLENNFKLFEMYFRNYTIFWIAATKTYSSGRPSGGCLFGFKKDIQKTYMLKFCNVLNNPVLRAQFNGEFFYFVPRYLNCTNWKNDFESFEHFMTEFKENNFCIIGDLNARLGEKQILDENILVDTPHINCSRCSSDKTFNTEGRKLYELIDDIGGIILNGRTRGDETGDFTFIGGRGNSVIDYVICSYSFIQLVENMSVGTKPFSDHMPVSLNLKFLSRNTIKNQLSKLRWNPKNAQKYTANLSLLAANVEIQSLTPVDELVDNIVVKIQNANRSNIQKPFFESNQPWFDCKCSRYRSRMTKCLNIYKNEYSEYNKQAFISAKTQFRQLCTTKKLQYYNETLEKLNSVRSSSEWWKLSNSLRVQSHTSRTILTSDEFVMHFSSLFHAAENSRGISWVMPYVVDPILDSPIELWEICSVVEKLKDKKAPGEDGICYEFYKNAPINFLKEVLDTFNKIFLHETIPKSFRTSILTPIFKKGDPTDPGNYRGLSLINTICKIFNSILLNRITFWIESNNILNEFQAGFRKNYSTVDNVFNLSNIVEINKDQGNKTYAFFVDFSCAFDTISRNCLFYKLSSLGLSSKIIRVLQATYDHTQSKIWDSTMFSDSFPVEVGVKQGCILSPILFSLFLNDLVDYLSLGVTVAGVNVKALLYADDIVLLANSPIDLQTMIDKLHAYCKTWSLHVNLAKSKVLVFRTGNRISGNLRFKYGNNDIEIVNSYKYLGVEMTFNLSYKSHLSSKLSSSKLSINSTWSKYINNPRISKANKLNIFNAASKSIMLYCAQVWGVQKYDEVEKLLRFFIKKMLFLHKTTPNYVLHLETGIPSLYLTTISLHFEYIEKVLKLPPARLPRILATYIIQHKLSWANEWNNLCSQYEIDMNYFESPSKLGCILKSKLRIAEWEANVDKGRSSQFHDLYSDLQYEIRQGFENFESWPTSLIIKARSGMLNLNARSFLSNSNGICSLCNTGETENTAHFIGSCPIFNSFRLHYFGSTNLNINEVICILNGTNYFALYKYIEKCLNYRNLIITEFNSI